MSSIKTTPDVKKPGFKSSETVIDILAVIDTDAVKAYCQQKNITPSQNQSSPTAVPHNLAFLVCTGADNIQNQGTGDLTFSAGPGDDVHFRGTTSYANSDDAIIIYGIVPQNGNPNVFNPFTVDIVTRNGAVVPDPSKPNGLPALHTKVSFSDYRSTVKSSGSELYIIQYALYELGHDKNTQNLYGYFEWDPTIVVS